MVQFFESSMGMFIFIAIGISIVVVGLNLIYSRKNYVWHEQSEIPERDSEIANISEDLIIYDLYDESQLIGYFDFEKNEFLDKYGDKLTFNYFQWRYRFFNV